MIMIFPDNLWYNGFKILNSLEEKSMYIDQLVYFLHVAENGSMNSTAQKFYMTQQAINASLKKMEAELDTPLVKRSNKGITLTPQGHIFAEYAKSIVQQYEDAVYELKRFNVAGINLTGTLSVFSSSIFTNLFLPDIIRNFMRIYPNTTIKIIEIGNTELLAYVFNNYCDVALFSGGKEYIESGILKHEQSRIKMLPLLEDTVVLCVRPDFPLMRYKTIDRNTLYQCAIEEPFSFSMYQIVPVRMSEDVYLASISNSSNAELHKKLILEGIVATYMPKLAYQYEFQKDSLASIEVTDSQIISHCMLYHDNPESPNYQLQQVFLNFVQKQFRQRFGAYIQKDPQ